MRNGNENIERAHKLNLQYMLCAGPPGGTDSLDAWKRAAAFFNHLGTLCQKAGLQFAYHNHNHEFVVYEARDCPTDEFIAFDRSSAGENGTGLFLDDIRR